MEAKCACFRRSSFVTLIWAINFIVFCHCSTADESPKNRAEKRGPNDRLHANLVKWQGYPLQSPLLKLPMDLNGLALECFECILRYCGDMPQDHNFSEVKCVYTVLMVSFCSWLSDRKQNPHVFLITALPQASNPTWWGLLSTHETNHSEPLNVRRLVAACLAVTFDSSCLLWLLGSAEALFDRTFNFGRHR